MRDRIRTKNKNKERLRKEKEASRALARSLGEVVPGPGRRGDERAVPLFHAAGFSFPPAAPFDVQYSISGTVRYVDYCTLGGRRSAFSQQAAAAASSPYPYPSWQCAVSRTTSEEAGSLGARPSPREAWRASGWWRWYLCTAVQWCSGTCNDSVRCAVGYVPIRLGRRTGRIGEGEERLRTEGREGGLAKDWLYVKSTWVCAMR